MYSAEEKATAISFRLINENLPKFIGNIAIFDKIKKVLQDKIDELEANMNIANVEKFFKLENYAKNITQNQIDTYNSIIGGKTLKNGTKIQGLNEYINLYNQQQKDKKNRLPFFVFLFKQILSDRNTISWLPEQFEKDQDVLDSIKDFYLSIEYAINSIKELLQKIDSYDLMRIYLHRGSLTDISQYIFDDWTTLLNANEKWYDANYEDIINTVNHEIEKKNRQIDEEELLVKEIKKDIVFPRYDYLRDNFVNIFENLNATKLKIKQNITMSKAKEILKGNLDATLANLLRKKRISKATIYDPQKKPEKYREQRKKYLKNRGSFTFAELSEGVKLLALDGRDGNEIKSYFKSFGENNEKTIDIFSSIKTNYNDIKTLLEKKYPEQESLAEDSDAIQKIKLFLDSLKGSDDEPGLQKFIRPLCGKRDEQDRDVDFYNVFLGLYDKINGITPLYNKVRSYMTRKPYSTEKIKINFENATLADGWDVNKEETNTCILLRKNGLYYLAIMPQEHTKTFEEGKCEANTGNNFFEKMEYKQIANPANDLPNLVTHVTHLGKNWAKIHIKMGLFV